MFTMPGAFHAGFNTGANISVATNFSLPRWLATKSIVSICSCTANLRALNKLYNTTMLPLMRERERFDGYRSVYLRFVTSCCSTVLRAHAIWMSTAQAEKPQPSSAQLVKPSDTTYDEIYRFEPEVATPKSHKLFFMAAVQEQYSLTMLVCLSFRHKPLCRRSHHRQVHCLHAGGQEEARG